jgi:hypothetical protein
MEFKTVDEGKLQGGLNSALGRKVVASNKPKLLHHPSKPQQCGIYHVYWMCGDITICQPQKNNG